MDLAPVIAMNFMCWKFFLYFSGRAAPSSGGSRKFWWGGILKHKTSKIRMSSPKLRVIFWPKSEIQTFFSPKIRWSPKKKKKKVFTGIESDFSVRLRLVGGDGSRNGTELIEIEADFSAKIVTFRLVGGDASPPSPPLNPPLAPRGTKGGGAPQTALFLAAASRWWFLLSWGGQKTRRKVDQFGAMTIFVFGDQQRTWSYVEPGVLFLFSEITANLLNFAAPPAKKFVPSLGQRFSCGTVLRFEQGGSDHLNSPLVTSASIVPTIGLQTKLEA